MHTTDTIQFNGSQKKPRGRPLGAVDRSDNHTKLVPVTTTRCRYCKRQIITYGLKKVYTAWLDLGMENRGLADKVYLPGLENAKLVSLVPERPCHVCTRDLFHREKTGKFPDRSILWELRLNDRSLR